MINQSLKKLLILGGTAALLLLVGWGVVIHLSHRGLAKIKVKAIPGDSVVRVDNKIVRGTTLYISPGTHNISASRQYFQPVSQEINTRTMKPTATVYLLPVPNTKEAFDYLSSHPEIQQEREKRGAVAVNNMQDYLKTRYPILNKLPVYNSHYRIDYALSSDNSISFAVTLYPIINGPGQSAQYEQQLHQYQAEVLQFFKSNGLNPSDFSISYTPPLD